MSQKRVAIELMPHRFDVIVLHGTKVAARKRIPVSLPAEPAEWCKSLKACTSSLQEAVQELDIAGSPCVVLYRSPSQAVDLGSYPVRSARQAIAAARLASVDSLPYAAASIATEFIGCDTSGTRRQSHILLTAERDEVSAAIVQLINDSGLAYDSATPLDAVTLHRAAMTTVRQKSVGARLYIGEYSSFFLAGGAGSLHFARVVNLGLDALATALTRPLRVSPGADPIELSAVQARAILDRFGVPDRGDVVIESPRLTGGNVMPVLQPVLQRFIVELRQSLRFGLPEDQRASIAITLAGPGAGIRNFAKLIGQELSLAVEPEASRAAYDSQMPASEGGECAGALASLPLVTRMNLQPAALSAARRLRRAKHWLWSGAAAALLLIGFDAFTTGAQLSTARKNADAIAQRAAGQQQLQLTADRLVNAINAGRSLEQRIAQELAGSASDRALLQELSRLTPLEIRLTNIAVRREEDKTHCTLTGYAFAGVSGPTHSDLERFIDSLRASPLFEQVTLGNVQLGSLAGRPGQSFEASFIAAPVPLFEGNDAVATARTNAGEVQP